MRVQSLILSGLLIFADTCPAAAGGKPKPTILSRDPIPPNGYVATGLEVPVKPQPIIHSQLPVNFGQSDANIVELNGKLHVFGGTQPAKHCVLNTGTSTWVRSNDLPMAYESPRTAAVAGGVLYSLQNYNGTLIVYDEANDSWSDGAVIPGGISNSAIRLTTLNDKLLAIRSGGEVYTYTAQPPSWTPLTVAPVPQTDQVVDVMVTGNKMFLVYGYYTSREYKLTTYMEGGTWSQPLEIPTSFFGIHMVPLPGRILFYANPSLMLDLGTSHFAVCEGLPVGGQYAVTSLGLISVFCKTVYLVDPTATALYVHQKK